MRKLTFLLVLLSFMGINEALAQRTISGTVTSTEDDQSIPGVQVVVKGTSMGTTTNLDGEYSVEINNDAEILVFKFVGMVTQEIEIGAKTVINVVMDPEVVNIEGVVVTALGISREKKTLGYSVQDVSGDELNKAQQNDAISSLQGRVSGVQINSSTNMGGSQKILVRGASSITGNNEPLIIVDGVPMDNSNYNSTNAQAGYGGKDYGNMMNDLDPNEIESVSVLKGAAAALYGSRAGGGVILIETKKAKSGKESFSVNLSTSIDFEEKYLGPELQTQYGGGAIYDGPGAVNGFETVDVNGTQYLVPQFAVDESWGPAYNSDLMVAQWDAWGPDGELIGDARPWVKPENDVLDFYNLGVGVTTNLGVSKTGKNYGMRFNYGNKTVDGTLPGSSQKKNNFKLSGNANLTDDLKINANINFVKTYTKGRPEVGYGDNSVGQKFYQWGQRQLDYGLLEDYLFEDGTQRTWNRVSYDDATPKYADNPYWTVYENQPEDERYRFFGNVGASYQILDNLNVEGNIYGDHYDFYVREKVAVGSQATASYEEYVRTRSEYNYEGRLNYNTKFDKVDVFAVAGGNIRDYRYDRNYNATSGGLTVPGVYSLGNSVGAVTIDDYTEEKRVNSLFATAAFSYDGFLNLDLSFRNDWSSSLPDHENSYDYYGVSGSFVFSDLLDLDFMDLGKIRAGYSEVGNDTDPYEIYSTYTYREEGSFMGTPMLYMGADLANADLKSELIATSEIGLEMSFFLDRVRFNATYFNKSTTDQILPLEVSKATGYETKIINAGELVSKGLEFTLGLVPVRTDDFEWEIMTNLTSTEMTVESLVDGLDAIDIIRAPFGGVYLRASVGDEYGQLWGYDFIYDDDGNKVVDENGYYQSTSSLVPLGSIYPDYNLGINNSFSYKNFDLSFLIDIQKGGKFYSVTHMWGMYSGMLEETVENNIREDGLIVDGVQGTVIYNDDGSYTVSDISENDVVVSAAAYSSRFYHAYGTPSAQSVFDADYIKLRNFSLGYTFDKSQLNSSVFKSVRVSVYGRNMFTWGLDQKGFDPEMTVMGSGNIQGIDGGLQPSSRTYGFKLNVTI